MKIIVIRIRLDKIFNEFITQEARWHSRMVFSNGAFDMLCETLFPMLP